MARGDDVAERVLIGNVLVLDRAGSVGEAIAIADGKVLKVGRKDDVLRLRDERTQIEDFGTSTIIPGFNDTHAHSEGLGLQSLRPSLAGAKSIADVLARVKQIAHRTKPGEWIVTMPVGDPPYYWNAPQQLAEGRMPTRAELDQVAPDHPVYLSAPSGYWGTPPCHLTLNSLALKLNGIDRTTEPRAAGIEIMRDADGEPTGVIVEHNFLQLAELDLLPAVPRFTLEDRTEGLRRSLPLYNAKGTTSIYEGHGVAPDVIAGFRDLWERGELTMRAGLVVSPPWLTTAEAAYAMRHWLTWARGSGFGDDMLRISGVFVPYGGPPQIANLPRTDFGDVGWYGFIPQINTPGDFEEICMLAGRYGLRVHTLASDRLHEIVPILERVAEHYPIGARRWVIEHISKAQTRDLEKIKALGVGVTLIPVHYLWKVGKLFAGLSAEELDLLSPARALHELGVPVCAATDAVPNDPLFCLWVMATRKERLSGRVMGPGGILSNEAALRLLTVNGAWLTFDEGRKGPLLPGYHADLAVLSGNPVTTSGDDILRIKCQATMVGGRWVHTLH